MKKTGESLALTELIERLLDDVCKWLEENVDDYVLSESSFDVVDRAMLDDLRKAILGTKL